MSGYVTVIGGVNNGQLAGIVTVPASDLSSSQSSNLQTYLNQLTTGAEQDTSLLTNFDAVTGTTAQFDTNVTTGTGLFEITNTNGAGASVPGSASEVAVVPTQFDNLVTTVVVEMPGTVAVSGDGAATNYLLGSSSNAVVSTNGSSGFAGENQILDMGGNDTFYAAGNNVATLTGGLDRFKVEAGSDTVLATGSSSVQVGVPTGYAGKVDFVNSSTAKATVFGGDGAVTAFGGAGGGIFVGGAAGDNSLVGGSGSATLVGGNSGDFLEVGGATNGGAASSSALNNYMFAGTGNETLAATSVTKNVLFAAGSGADVMSASGSGTQYFFGGSGSATMTGSSAGQNVYFFGGTLSGGNDVITNFGFNNSTFVVLGGNTIEDISSVAGTNNYPQGGALVTLSDNTQVFLANVSASSLQGDVGGSVLLPPF